MADREEITPQQLDFLMSEAARAQDGDTKKLPSLPRQVMNFGKAVVKHVANSMARVDLSTYQHRLSICNQCDRRLKNRCTHPSCGCFLDKKAWWESEDCPEGKWDD